MDVHNLVYVCRVHMSSPTVLTRVRLALEYERTLLPVEHELAAEVLHPVPRLRRQLPKVFRPVAEVGDVRVLSEGVDQSAPHVTDVLLRLFVVGEHGVTTDDEVILLDHRTMVRCNGSLLPAQPEVHRPASRRRGRRWWGASIIRQARVAARKYDDLFHAAVEPIRWPGICVVE